MKETKVEQFLTDGQFKFQYIERVLFAEIDMTASQNNPARQDRRLDEERALQYGLKMQSGIAFPAIVLLNLPNPKPGGPKYIVATGMHRLTGADAAGLNSIDAYVVYEADLYRREYLYRFLNSIEGLGISIAEQVHHVLWLHNKFPDKSLRELAKEADLKPHLVQTYANERRALQRARGLGYDLQRAKIPQTILVTIGSIKSDPVFKEAVIFVCNVPVYTQGIKDMVAEINKARDEKSQLEIVKKYYDEAEKYVRSKKARTAKVKPAAANQAMREVRRVIGALDRPMASLHVSALEQRETCLMQVREAMEYLRLFADEIERVERMSRPEAA